MPVAFPAVCKPRLAYTFPAADPFLPIDQLGTTITSRLVAIRVR